MADMAERTPLATVVSTARRAKYKVPKEFVAVFHELRLEEVHGAGSYPHPLQVAGESGEEWVVCVQLDLAWGA